MHILEKISEFVGKWMAVVVLAIAALSLFLPKSTLWIELSWVNYLLMVVMFGMGLTLKLTDFALVFARPKEITIGCAAQFIVMPALAFALSKIFGLDAALMAGVVLVGTCPGGTSSNVITYLSKGDVALSVGMTSVNTLLAPVLTPAITYLLLRTTVNVDVMAMFLSIVKVVIVPIALGFVINKFFSKWTARAVKVLPLVSVIAIAMIVAAVVSHNAAKILSTGAIVFAVVILHNLLGYLPWQPFLAPFSPYGTTSPAQSSRTFTAGRNKKISQRTNVAKNFSKKDSRQMEEDGYRNNPSNTE